MHKSCERCGACCSDLLPVTPDEIATLRAYAQTHKIRDRQRRQERCPFLRGGRWKTRCAVYKVRPAICRIYNCTKPQQEMLKEYHRQCGIAHPRSIRSEVYQK